MNLCGYTGYRHSATLNNARERLVLRAHFWIAITKCDAHKNHWDFRVPGSVDSALERDNDFRFISITLHDTVLKIHHQER
jgi:hypothetical protein